MKSTKKTAVTSKDGKTVFAQGRMWDAEDLKKYREYQHKFAKKYRLFTFRFDQTSVNDLALVNFLESQDSLTGYLRDLITKDLESKDALTDYRKAAEEELRNVAKMTANKTSEEK